MYTTQFCAKFFGALLLLLVCAKYASAAFPKDTAVPSAAWSNTLALTYADDFTAAVNTNSYWTATGTTAVLTAASSPAPSYYSVPVNDPASGASATVVAQNIAQTTAFSTGSLGIRIVSRVKFVSDAGTSLLPVVGIMFKEAAGAGASPKTYYAAIEGKSASGTTQDKFTQKVGYTDPSLAAGSRDVLQTQTVFDAVSDYAILSIDIKPTNITWGAYDSTKANAALPYLAPVGTAVTSVTPYSSGNAIIGGGSAVSANSATSTTLTAQVDWIAFYTYQTASASGSAASSLQYSVVSAILSLLFFAIYLQ